MGATRFFLDSNVLIYSVSQAKEKTEKSKQLLLQKPTISVQVLNEFMRVATNKFMLPLEEALKALQPAKIICDIVPLTVETHERAIDILRKHKYSIYDCNIIAAAELSDCDILYSEDMNHGQIIGRVQILNPFMAV